MNPLLWLAVSSIVWGGVLCLAAMLLQRNSNLSGRVRQWIWRSAMVLLIAPWLAAPVVSALGLGLAPAEQVTVMAPAEVAAETTVAMATFDQAGPNAASIVREDSGWMPQGLSPIETILLIVMLGWVVRFVLAQLSARTLMGIVVNSEAVGAGAARRALEGWSAKLKLRRQPELRFAAGRVSPFSYGIFRPVIVLPEGLERQLDAKTLDLVVGHECLHVARGDGWLRPLERIVADVMWFNPFAWVMRREADVARELAVDEGVVAISDSRRAYARALRDVAGLAVGLQRSLPAASMSLAGSGRSLVLRMQRTLALAKRKPARAAMLAAVALGVAGACTSVGQAMLATPAVAQTPRAPVAVAPKPLLVLPAPGRINVSDDQTPVAPVAPQTPARAPQAPAVSRNETMRGATRPVLTGEATLISPFGPRIDPFNPGRTDSHLGIDLKQSWGAPVHTPADGTVTFAGVRGTNGRVVDIAMADGYSIRLAHLNAFSVATGDKVEAGQKIGAMGSTGRSTGPHLHLEVLREGKNYNPQDIPGLIFADTLTVALETPPAPPPAASTVTPDVSPSPSPTPIAMPQAAPRQAPLPKPTITAMDPPAPVYAPMKMRVVSVEPDDKGTTVALESLVTEGVNKGCKLRTTAMTDVKVRTGDAIDQGALVGTRNANSDRYVNCGMQFAQLMLFEGNKEWMAAERALKASRIPPIPDTPAMPATPSALTPIVMPQQERQRGGRTEQIPAPVITQEGDTELPPKLLGATHSIVGSPARFTSEFGNRIDPFDASKSGFHSGVDIAKEMGAPIYSPAAATVWRAEPDPEQGNVVVLGIEGGYTLRFGRLQEIKVKRGDAVRAGDILGTMGSTGASTGPHLHLETFWNGRAYNPQVVPGLTLIGPA